uniref:Dynamin N-terminal domain-containing protein n=1 Tax=Chromera velia CCMP2878 TaxID=1169474 RepID=A0A0G4GP20_9ALVE|eukprot:Cvel_5000.t1-p1 / transcript=Cvel_5000.t1 / gene=Cvel_5000 / organism=Chromera_velia_CCMP2878 / gene_product=Protein msp1, mitochondrial, putative / transcript_product=Protein msp1, mitochondrial, putative / location=Cvel_scaffold226:87918-88586(-) / protein_length=223 / sequence_SO=supercontig / SO=protein_coding / is_pseudo=false
MSRQTVSFGRKPSGSVTQSDVCPYSLLGFNENERSEFEDKDARGETVAVDRALLQRFTQKIAENASDPDAKGDLTGAFMLLRSAQTRKACLMQRLVREKEGQKMGGIVERLLTRNIYGQVLRAIKSIGGDFSALRLPRIVIIGDENTGKSSTLERIAMRRCFPRSSSLCTRMALRLRMVHSWDERLMFLKHVNSNGEVKVHGCGGGRWTDLGERCRKATDLFP